RRPAAHPIRAGRRAASRTLAGRAARRDDEEPTHRRSHPRRRRPIRQQIPPRKRGSSMRIFFVCQRVPFPPDRGDKITTFNEIRHLSAQHDVHVFCLGDGRRDLDNLPGLSDYAQSVTAVPVNAWTSKLRALRALIAGRPLSVAAFAEPELHAAIKQKFIELKPDLIMVYSCNVAQFADHFPQVPRIMQFAELDSSRWGQYAKRSPIPLRWIYSIEQRRFLDYERRI